jgi:asparagine synthase (glutamine-hydrolysing)
MCGITGFISTKINSKIKIQEQIKRMTNKLGHRGPDFEDMWIDNNKNIAFGHRRLSILDLSSNGNQPMISSNKRYIIVFNGEIYNHLKIRKKLTNSNINWKSNSDTETLLESISLLGLSAALNLCVGMFAFGLWDSKKEILTLARDRFGEKPLYYGWIKNSFVFGSELKAIKEYDNFDNELSKPAIAQFLKLNYIPAPLSIYDEIFKLKPATFKQFKKNLDNITEINSEKYWQLDNIIQNSKNNVIKNEIDSIKEIKNSLNESVKLQMISDVPIGSFLSGGIDSSLITAIMQDQSSKPIKTFTVGFEEFGFNESSYAKKISSFLNTTHNEIFLKSKDALDVIPNLGQIYDEPFADSSQIPTFLVSKFAKQEVSVILSGDGADEIFGGYNRYTLTPVIWKKISLLPYPIRKIIGKIINRVPIQFWDIFGDFLNLLIFNKNKINRFGDKVHKMSRRFETSANIDEFNQSFAFEWQDLNPILKDYNDQINFLDYKKELQRIDLILDSPSERMMYLDIISYLTDDILCKVDRASMSNSLETRVPFLNHNLFELGWRLPENLKIKNNQGKWVLRQILKDYIPEGLFERPKSGFSIPLADWLRGPLRDWADALINEKRIEDGGYFYFKKIKKMWDEHLSGRYDWSSRLWSILIFQSWLMNENINH